MFPAEEQLRKALQLREDENALRKLQVPSGIDFLSNDYLGFASKGLLADKIKDISHLTTGSTGSRLLSGQSKEVSEAEQYLSKFYQSEACLIYNSGYDANVGLFSSIAKRTDTILYDELIHASIRDGIRLSGARSYSFKHNSIDDLRTKMKFAQGNVFVAVESIYSMDGDQSPLEQLADYCEKENLNLIVDEAHSTGTFGKYGEGLVLSLELKDKVFARVYTFGKGMGCHGAAVCGSNDLIQYLINFSRSFIYTTALPPYSYLTIKKAHELSCESAALRENLNELVSYFNHLIDENNLERVVYSKSAVQTISFPGNSNVKRVCTRLNEQRFMIKPILSPTVPKGKERLRICLHAFNTKEQVETLIKTIKSV